MNKNVNHSNFSIIGQNISGLNSKIDSLLFMLNKLKPSCVLIQESKLRKTGTVRLPGYQIFEKL